MLPLFKLFSLFVRILARPVIARTKAHTSSNLSHGRMRDFFVWTGNRAHRVNVIINRKFLKLNSTDFKVQEISETAALELGVETFYEVIIYLCILGLPIIEIYNNYVEGLEKSEKQKVLMDSIGDRLAKLESEATEAQTRIDTLKKENDALISKSAELEDNLNVAKSLLQNHSNTLLSIQAIKEQFESNNFADLLKANQL